MRILLLSAHIDDADTGCGGSVARYAYEGNEIYYAVFTLAEESLPADLPKDIMVKELEEATRVLGIRPSGLIIKKYPVRRFPQYRQEILEDMVQMNKEINPSLVFMPSKFDTHQDHAVIAEEGFRAFKMSSILGYELPWNNVGFNATSFICLKECHLDRKIKALTCYRSQKLRSKMLERPVDNSSKRIRAWAEYRGMQIREDFAEAFNILRWIVR